MKRFPLNSDVKVSLFGYFTYFAGGADAQSASGGRRPKGGVIADLIRNPFFCRFNKKVSGFAE
jgi:hypothetical protein